MASPAYYRTEAERCRDLAKASPDSAIAARWRQLASEYDLLAQSMETIAPHSFAPSQSQPMQQQQSKKQDEK